VLGLRIGAEEDDGMKVWITLLALLAFAVCEARADTITFNGTFGDGNAGLMPSPYSEAGYTLVAVGEVNLIDNDFASIPGFAGFDDDFLEFDDDSASFVLTRDDGNAFDLLSVVTGSPGRTAFDDGNFVFTGNISGGGTIMQTVAAVGPSQTTHNFVGFTNLESVSVTSTDGEFPSLDDIVLQASSPVPEPSMFVLLGAAAGALVLRRRKAS
jgi:hypothetical protein